MYGHGQLEEIAGKHSHTYIQKVTVLKTIMPKMHRIFYKLYIMKNKKIVNVILNFFFFFFFI
jgi:hypothetical protein